MEFVSALREEVVHLPGTGPPDAVKPLPGSGPDAAGGSSVGAAPEFDWWRGRERAVWSLEGRGIARSSRKENLFRQACVTNIIHHSHLTGIEQVLGRCSHFTIILQKETPLSRDADPRHYLQKTANSGRFTSDVWNTYLPEGVLFVRLKYNSVNSPS